MVPPKKIATRGASPSRRRKRTEGNEEKWFRKTNVPESLLVAELIDISEGREMASLFPESKKLRRLPNTSAVV